MVFTLKDMAQKGKELDVSISKENICLELNSKLSSQEILLQRHQYLAFLLVSCQEMFNSIEEFEDFMVVAKGHISKKEGLPV